MAIKIAIEMSAKKTRRNDDQRAIYSFASMGGLSLGAELEQPLDDFLSGRVCRFRVGHSSLPVKIKQLVPDGIINSRKRVAGIDIPVHSANGFLPNPELNPIVVGTVSNHEFEMVSLSAIIKFFQKNLGVPLISFDVDLDDCDDAGLRLGVGAEGNRCYGRKN